MAFNMFPFSNLHDLNLDWVLRTIKAAVETVQTFAARLTQAESDIQDLETSRVSYAESQTLTSTQKARARNNIGAASAEDLASGLVRYDTVQELTGEQQTTARGNIGAAPNVGTVRYNEAQELGAAYQTRARQNIGAASAEDLTALGVRVAGDEDLIAGKLDQREPRGEGTLFMTSWYDDSEQAAYSAALSLDSGLNHRVSILPGITHGRDGFELQSFDGNNSGPAYIEGVKTPVRDDQAANKVYVDGRTALDVTVTMETSSTGYIPDKSYNDIATYDQLKAIIPSMGYAFTLQAGGDPKSYVGVFVISQNTVPFTIFYQSDRWNFRLGYPD